MGSSSFHMFIYARSEQCDLDPINTISNTQRIRIYSDKLKFILVKISPNPGRLHGKHAKENQTLFTFLTTENFNPNLYGGGGANLPPLRQFFATAQKRW